MRELMMEAGRRAVRYLDGANGRPVIPSSQAIAGLRALDIPLPDGPTDPLAVLAELDENGPPATVATTGGRYFGFVTGGSLPATVGAGMLAAAWDQNAVLEGDRREPSHFVPELSRRARGIEVWAALRSLGRAGLADPVERSCRHAARFAKGIRAAGHCVLNQVDLNQVLVSSGDGEATRGVMRRVQEDGTCWCGGTVWQGRAAMRISVSCWATTEEEAERSLAAILRVAAKR
jgi:hypothetical protein